MKILIVEDEKDFSVPLKDRLLQFLNADIEIVEDPRHVQPSVSQCRPDIILLDLALKFPPNETGLPVLRNLKRNYYTKNIPIIILSGHSDTETVKSAIIMGANDYVVKPPDMEDLIQRMKKLIPETKK